jgi:protein TonB
MNSALAPVVPAWQVAWPTRAWWRQAVALGAALLLHGLALIALLGNWQAKPPAEPQVRTLTTQLISLAPAAVAAPALPPAEPVPAPVPTDVVPARVEPPLAKAPLEQAKLARKRVEQLEQKREQAREQLRAERQRQDQQRAADALAQQQASQQVQQRQQHEAAAAADARARAAADASRQYLPIAKEAPDYPERALDKGIEGDCSVSYTVTAQGRVDSPQVAGDCHPLFVRPSLAAAKTFRYQPRIVDGHAVAVANVRNTFHYRIQE